MYIDKKGEAHESQEQCRLADMSVTERALERYLDQLKANDYSKKRLREVAFATSGMMGNLGFHDSAYFIYSYYFYPDKMKHDSVYEGNMCHLMELQFLALMDVEQEQNWIYRWMAERRKKEQERSSLKRMLLSALDDAIRSKKDKEIAEAVENLKSFYN